MEERCLPSSGVEGRMADGVISGLERKGIRDRMHEWPPS